MGISNHFWKTFLTVGNVVEKVRGELTAAPRGCSSRRLELSQLEDRLLLSASPVIVVEQADSNPHEDPVANPDLEDKISGDAAAGQAGSPANLHESDSSSHSSDSEQMLRQELVFIDAAVEDYELLVADLLSQQGLDREFEVRLLDGERNGIEQITEVLAQMEGLDAVHFVSHGNDHSLKLGNTWLDSQSFAENLALIESWNHALSADADLLFYGCDLAGSEAGRSLLANLQNATGVDVAASTDDTGYALFGGDWNLEFFVGSIETDIAFSTELQTNWRGLLATEVFLEGANGYTGTQDTELREESPNANQGSDLSISVDLEHGDDDEELQGLIRFDNLFGNGPGQIPIGATITSASLTVNVVDSASAGSQVTLHRMLTNWTEASTWNSLVNGVSANDVEAKMTPDATLANPDQTGFQTFTGLESTLQAWSNGDTNFGWVLLNNSTDGWDFRSSEDSTVSNRPFLTISYVANQAPSLMVDPGPVNYVENSLPIRLDATATVTDLDSPNFNTGTLTVDFAPNGTANDRLAIRNEGTGSGEIGVSGSNVTYEGTIIGTFSGGTDGSTPLVVTFNSNATLTETQALLQNVTFENVSEDPDTTARTVRFVLTDGDGGTSMTETVSVNVIAENDIPQITTSSAFRSYTENAVPITIDPALSISDVDDIQLVGATVRISGNFVSGEDVLTFTNQSGIAGSWDAMTGVLTLTGTSLVNNYQMALQSVTYHNTSEDPSAAIRTFEFIVNDPSDPSSPATRDISIMAVNDRPIADDVSAMGNEDAPSIPITLTGSDVDGVVDQFRLSSLPTNGTLFTDAMLTTPAATGVNYTATAETLTLFFVPDPEWSGTTTFQYVARDAGGLDDLTPATATITVSAENDNPVITSNGGLATAMLSVAENSTTVTTVTSTDNDGGVPNYSISGGADQMAFGIDAMSGDLTFQTAPDFENATDNGADNTYEVEVTVTDGNGGFDVQTLFVTVTDENDNAPIIDPGQNFTVSEAATNGSSVGTATATDADTVGSLQNWQITAGNIDGIFTINSASGEITILDDTNLDFETTNNYTLTLTVSDGVNTSASETVLITINDENDNAPIIDPGQRLSINENAANGTSVGTVTATDADTVGSFQNWQITAGNVDGVFTINSASGEITILDNTNLDFETTNSYTLSLAVSDGVNTSASETVLITINDANDNAPIIDPGQSFSINENAANGTSVGTVTANDADTVGSLQNWQITAGNIDGVFTIDSASGEITILDDTNLDFETTNSYTLSLAVSDGVNTSASETVLITINDENDNAPIIDPGQNFTVSESTTYGTSVGTATATDADTVGSFQNWHITAGNIDGIFTINSASGEITILDNTNLDFETTNNYTLTLTVSDGVNTSASETVLITINDANDNAPLIDPGQNFTVTENSATGTTLGRVAATDSDTVDSLQNWQIVGGNADGIFAINSSTGELTIAMGNRLDFEMSPQHVLTLTVDDGTNTSPAQTVTINVVNLNEAPSVILSVGTLVYFENAGPVSVDALLRVQDPDAAPLTEAMVQISGNYQPGEDRLVFQNQLGIIGGFNADTGSLILSGAASAADYETALRSVAYENTSEDPNTALRQISFTISDGTFSSPSIARDVRITAENDAPRVLVPKEQATISNEPLVFSTLNGNPIRLLDVDGFGEIFELTLSASQGVVTLSTAFGLELVRGDGFEDREIIVRGTLDQLNQAVEGLEFQVDSNATGAGLSLLLEDTGSQMTLESISIASINVGPAPKSESSTPRSRTSDSEDDSDEELKLGFVSLELLENSQTSVRSESIEDLLPLTEEITEVLVDPSPPESENPFIFVKRSESRELKSSKTERSSDSDDQKSSDDRDWERDATLIGFNSKKLFNQLDSLQETLDQQEQNDAVMQTLIAGTSALVAGSLTVGYMIWILRVGSLLTAMMSYLPAWVLIDPLPILDGCQDPVLDSGGSEDDSLTSLATPSESRK